MVDVSNTTVRKHLEISSQVRNRTAIRVKLAFGVPLSDEEQRIADSMSPPPDPADIERETLNSAARAGI